MEIYEYFKVSSTHHVGAKTGWKYIKHSCYHLQSMTLAGRHKGREISISLCSFHLPTYTLTIKCTQVHIGVWLQKRAWTCKKNGDANDGSIIMPCPIVLNNWWNWEWELVGEEREQTLLAKTLPSICQRGLPWRISHRKLPQSLPLLSPIFWLAFH